MTDTTPDGLHKQTHGAANWDGPLNDNFDILQAALTERASSLESKFLATNRSISAGAGIYTQRAAPPAFNAVSDFSTIGAYLIEWSSPTLGPDSYTGQNWIVDAPVVDTTYWAATFPAKTTLSLPRGLYLWNIFCVASVDLVTTVEYTPFMDYVHDPGAHYWTFLNDGTNTVKASSHITGRIITGAGMLAIETNPTAIVPYIGIPTGAPFAGTLIIARLNIAKVG